MRTGKEEGKMEETMERSTKGWYIEVGEEGK